MSTTEPQELSATGVAVLGLVALMGEATSYDMKQAAQASIGNFWSFPHSQLYAEPQKLAERGLLEEEQEEGGRRRRVFRLTETGRSTLRSWLADPETPPVELRDEGLLKLAFAAEAGDDELRVLARRQQEIHREWIEHYEGLAQHLAPTGATRFNRAALEMGRRYRRVSLAFWRDVETLDDTGEMPTIETHNDAPMKTDLKREDEHHAR
ncbi:PadR family transcriptional regulator [Egibacter rhizosphaerae]|uniref:PadR family transcriptional regulator n=1 Tax=Egibacter rhizosphaerae TaxID=1670831 RepID=A0A411YC96_9ACTN|nr:helix-turn-helix transcriptional regulator [Egibacter rhizosphaerae]QBI18808.1 PadR family transcriptional regulator [Egibacter rhizosphaerae]